MGNIESVLYRNLDYDDVRKKHLEKIRNYRRIKDNDCYCSSNYSNSLSRKCQE